MARPIRHEDLAGIPGFRRTAKNALVAAQPKTVMEALAIPYLGRATTQDLLARGLLTDPEGIQEMSMAAWEKQERRRSAARPAGS